LQSLERRVDMSIAVDDKLTKAIEVLRGVPPSAEPFSYALAYSAALSFVIERALAQPTHTPTQHSEAEIIEGMHRR